MPLFSNAEQISSGCATQVDGFRKLYEFHSLRSGSPSDFLQLAPKLASSEGFRLDFSDLVRTIRDGERGRLSAAEMLTIVGLAIGGPGVARAEAELYESAGTVQVLLAGVGGWREAGAGPRAERRVVGAEGGSDGSRVAGSLLDSSGGESHRRDDNGVGGVGGGADGPGSERGWGERGDAPSGGAASGGRASPEMNETLARLELASMQMKVYLDDIDRRMGRIEPHLEGLTAMVQTSTERFDRIGREAGQREAQPEAGETTRGQSVPGAAGPGRRRRSEETIAAAMERSAGARNAGARNGFEAGAVEPLADGGESAEPEVGAPEEGGRHANRGLADRVTGAERWRRPIGWEARRGDATTELPEVRQEAAGKPEETRREVVGEPKVIGSEVAGEPKAAGGESKAQPKFIRYEAARVVPREMRWGAAAKPKEVGEATVPERAEIRREAVGEEKEAGQEIAPALKEIGREATSEPKRGADGARAAARVMPEGAPETGSGLSVAGPAQVGLRVPARVDLRVPARSSALVAVDGGGVPKRPGWAWGATAAGVLLVAASVVALYGPWHLTRGRVEVAGAGPGSGIGAAPAAGVRADGVRVDTAMVGGGSVGGSLGNPFGNPGGGAGGVAGNQTGNEFGNEFGNGSGGRGRNAASGGADRGGAERQSGDRGVADGAMSKPSTAVPTAVLGSGGTGGGAKESAVAPPVLPASAAMSGAAPSGAVEAPSNQVVAVQGEAAPRNRVEGARAEDPSRVARVENLHPEDSTERAAGGSGPSAHGETAGLATTGALAPTGTLAPRAGGPAAAKAPLGPSASAGVPVGAGGGGRDVPRTTVGRPELTPVGTGGTVISAPSPIYPQQARQLGLEGQVVIRATVNRAGAVTGIQVINGPVLLQQSAQDAVRRRRYKPFLVRGEPVEFQTMVTLIYRLGK